MMSPMIAAADEQLVRLRTERRPPKRQTSLRARRAAVEAIVGIGDPARITVDASGYTSRLGWFR
jgi:hypothetical protein